MLVALQYEKSSRYSILISLFGCPLLWIPGAVVPIAPYPPLYATAAKELGSSMLWIIELRLKNGSVRGEKLKPP